MARKIKIIIGTTLLFILVFGSTARAESATMSDIAKQLICQCGCTLVLANCTHGECMSRDGMLTLIEQKLAKGESATGIVQFFVAQYGEQVLSAPTKKGFNLTAWITPFAAILAGAAVIALALRTWVKRGGQAQTITRAETGEGEEKYRRRVEKELAQFTEKGFR